MSWINELKVGDTVFIDKYSNGDIKEDVISKIFHYDGKELCFRLTNDNRYNYPRDIVESCFLKDRTEAMEKAEKTKKYLKVKRCMDSIGYEDTVLIDALYKVIEENPK